MKIHAVSIVLLLTASALAGCAGSSDSDTDHEIAGTTWIVLTQIEGYDAGQMIEQFGEYAITIRTFGENGSMDDFILAGEDGCPFGTVSFSEDELLCEWSMDMGMDMEANTWRIDDYGHVEFSSGMIISGDDLGEEMDEMSCNMMANYWLNEREDFSYSVETTINWMDDENACEFGMQVDMKVIIEDGSIVYYTLHPVSGGGISEEECAVGIEWTGQAEMTESEISTFDALLDQCPDPIPWDAVVWECELNVRFDSLAELSAQSYNESISDHPGYPEWCGRVVPDDLALDGSESNLPPAEDMYGIITDWWVYARNETHWMDSWFEQEDCNNEGEYWDEKYGMCAMPVGCPTEADSQLIYEECLPWQWARYHWSGDYLYIGMPSDRWM
ncbi:MAG: hypothetical protein VYB47_00315 [Candidatus Thermoplasmatota archaeon]|nr:hypothetical protein [Candidatus Thermoplasmatota archaeon]